MMNDINIVWNSGRMQIHLENFFPSSAERLKKLFKTIALDFEHEEQILSDIKDYLFEAAALYESEKKVQGKEYWRLNQIVADLGRAIKAKKKPNGVPYTKDELAAEKEYLKTLKSQMQQTKTAAESAIRKLKTIQKNIEQLKDHVHKKIN